MRCMICGKQIADPGYVGIEACPYCEQEYTYDEGACIVLSPEQIEVLRKLKNL